MNINLNITWCMVWYKHKDLLGCIHIHKFIINKSIEKFTASYWISSLKKNLKTMHDSYKYWISKKKKKKYVAYLDLNKALSGTVSSDTVPVDKWSG